MWYNLSMVLEESLAYWINPNGNVIGTHGSHTSTVMESPCLFGLTVDEAKCLFANGEEIAVLQRLVRLGWIRIRFQGSCYFISVNMLNKPSKLLLCSWALGVLALHNDRKENVVVIEELKVLRVSKISLGAMSVGNFTSNNSLVVGSWTSFEYADWSLMHDVEIG